MGRDDPMNTLALRVILLAALLFALNAWSVRHTGTDLGNFAALNGFILCVTLVLGWLDKREADALQDRANTLLRQCVETRVLVPLYIIALLATSLLSSVTVLADGESRSIDVYLTPEGRSRDKASLKTLDGPSDVVRYLRFTSLFGRPLYLEASGYQRHSFSLMPWAGATISLRSHLQQLPTILLRIPRELLTVPGNTLFVESAGADAATPIPLTEQQGSVMIGSAGVIPPEWRSDWRGELGAVEDIHPVLLEKTLLLWRNPVRNESVAGLVPGQQIVVRLETADGTEHIRQTVVIGDASMQDVALARKEQPQ
jgi:hypothetical protein